MSWLLSTFGKSSVIVFHRSAIHSNALAAGEQMEIERHFDGYNLRLVFA